MDDAQRLVLERRYPLPEVRLRFRSTEMAVLTNAAGETLLATAAFSNIESHLVLLSPAGEVRRIIRDANVGWAMQADEHGRLISGGWDLTRFDPDTGRFERLLERPVAPEQLWSACVTARHIVIGSSTPCGTVAVYDRRTRAVAREFSPIHSHAFYTYDILAAPDGRILIFSCAPRAVITVLDPENLEIESVIPAALEGAFRMTGAKMLDGHRLFVLTETGGVVLRYPDWSTVARIETPAGAGLGLKTCRHAGSVVAWGANRPWLLDCDAWRWTPMTDEPIGHPSPEHAEACFAMASLGDGALVGVTDTSCLFWRLEAGSRRPIRKTIEIAGHTDGAPLAIGGGRAFGSSHAMQRFWSIDLDSGQGRDLGQCSLGGQANAMWWDDRRSRLFLATYPEGRIRVFDPAQPPAFPDNPGTFAQIDRRFSRFSHQLLRIGDGLWTCIHTVPPQFGGAIVRIDLVSREVETFADLVRDEAPEEMVLGPDGRTLYLGTTVQADNGANIPVSDSAHLLAFDSRTKTLARCERPIEGAQTLSALCFAPDGRLLFLDGPRLARGRSLWAWDVARDRFERIGSAPDGLREIVPCPDGAALWATAFEGLGSLSLADECRIDFARGLALLGNRWDQKMCKHLQWRDGELWCVCFTEVLRFRPPRSSGTRP